MAYVLNFQRHSAEGFTNRCVADAEHIPTSHPLLHIRRTLYRASVWLSINTMTDVDVTSRADCHHHREETSSKSTFFDN